MGFPEGFRAATAFGAPICRQTESKSAKYDVAIPPLIS
jgi:hypothetical protein